MRAETDKAKIEAFITALGQRVEGRGRIYFAGGATALLYGWRTSTIDIDVKADPEPPKFFEALAMLREELDINIEMASSENSIPAILGWRDRSLFVGHRGALEFFHYDPDGQALAKIQRAHERDLLDVRFLIEKGIIHVERLPEMFAAIEAQLIRYPAIDAASFRAAVLKFCHERG